MLRLAMTSLPFAFSSGPRRCPIAFVGDYWGEHDETYQRPFVGFSGVELARMLQDAEFPIDPFPQSFMTPAAMASYWDSQQVFLTNVLPLRPPGGKIANLCGDKATVGKAYTYPPFKMGEYLLPEFLPELERLKAELDEVRPNIIVALGNVACWALLRVAAITAIRGAVTTARLAPGVKVLPTVHPSYVLRQWASRTIVVLDLMKAGREMAAPEFARPARRILINPTMAEIWAWIAQPTEIYAADIETKLKTITCIGFARAEDDALVIPFVGRHDGSYWPTHKQEVEAWGAVGHLLECDVPKVWQNGLYDLSYLARMGFRPRACLEDTMLLHHAKHPEMQKGLGFLGSIYTNEPSWKLMRRHRADEKGLKADE